MVLSIFDGISLITHFFLWINKGIYWLAEKSYNLLIDIASVQLFSSDSLRDFGVRIYVLLGVLMLFKLSISLINYIVNPDSFDDKSKGFSKLIINVCIVLVLIVTTPFIFSLAMKFQHIVLNDNLIPNLFLGMGSETGDEVDYSDAGERMSFLVFSSFFRPNPALFDDELECKNYLFTSGDGETNSGAGLDFGNTLDDIQMKEECAEVLNEATGTGFDGQVDELFTFAYATSNINVLTDTNLIKATSEVNGEKVSTFDFHGLIALIAGGFLAWIMVMFCFDVAIRTVKLVFLQLIAPIPIIAYADPKGNELFKKWLKQCISTYLDLFIRLAAVFFAVFIVMKLPEAGIVVDNGGDPEPISNPLIYVFIVLGVLMFANQLPKLIENITGIKMDGGFTLNPMKKIGQSTFASAAVGGLAGAAGSALMNTVALGKNIHKDGWKKTFAGKDAEGNLNTGFNAFRHGARTAFTGVGGAGSALIRGSRAGLAGKGKDGVNRVARQAVTDASKARNLREQGFGVKEKFGNYLTDIGQYDYKAGSTNIYDDRIKLLTEDLKNAEQQEAAAANAAQIFMANSQLGAKLSSAFGERKAIYNDDGSITYQYTKGNKTGSLDDIYREVVASGEFSDEIEAAELEKYKGMVSAIDDWNAKGFSIKKDINKTQKALDGSKGSSNK